MEHDEISRCGTPRARAERVGAAQAVGLPEEALAADEDTDELLSEPAEAAVDPAAAGRAG